MEPEFGGAPGRVPGAHPHRDPLHRAVAEQVDSLRVWDRAVRTDADDSVHQMRVALRRIRSLLQAAPQAFGLAGDAAILAELRWLAGLLGVARDAEVLAERYRAALGRMPPALVRGPVADRLVGGAEQRYRDGRRAALAAMDSRRYRLLLDDLGAVLAEPAPPAVGAATDTASIDTAYRRVRRATAAARAAGASGRDQALHRIRKGAKRLRYIAAAAGATRVAQRAKEIQTLLGDHQDSVVSRAHLLREAAAAQTAGEDTFTYGLLYQQEQDLADRCRGRLDGALDRLAAAMDDPGGRGRVGL